jgi:hypothetical protein
MPIKHLYFFQNFLGEEPLNPTVSPVRGQLYAQIPVPYPTRRCARNEKFKKL